jgi:hypothetical protein
MNRLVSILLYWIAATVLSLTSFMIVEAAGVFMDHLQKSNRWPILPSVIYHSRIYLFAIPLIWGAWAILLLKKPHSNTDVYAAASLALYVLVSGLVAVAFIVPLVGILSF